MYSTYHSYYTVPSHLSMWLMQSDIYKVQPDIYRVQPDIYRVQPDIYIPQSDLYKPQSDIHMPQSEEEDPLSNTTKLRSKEIVLYKTESCRNWAELGHCRYGKKCRYAHGQDELRSVPRHVRYKTQICRAYHMDGSCPYGIRCTFVHDSDREKTADKWNNRKRRGRKDSAEDEISDNSSSDDSIAYS